MAYTWGSDELGTFQVTVEAIDKSERVYYKGKVVGKSSTSVTITKKQDDSTASCYQPGDDMSLPPACE